MATRLWIGGASTAAQVNDLTLGGTWEADDVLKTTVTDEDGTEVTVTTVAGSTTIETIRDNHLADLQAATSSLFTALTFAASGTDEIRVTANVAGVPFFLTATTTETGGGAADAQTYVVSSITANAGPNDWDTLANWSGATLPVVGDDVIIADSEYDILYNLDQTGIGTLASLRIGRTYTGIIGQQDNGYYLQVSATTLTFAGRGNSARINGTFTNAYVLGGLDRDDMLRLDGTITTLRVESGLVLGTVGVAYSAALTNLYVLDCPRAKVEIGSGVSSLALIEMNSGIVENESAVTAINQAGGYLKQEDGAVGTYTGRGGTCEYNTDGTLTTETLLGATFDLRNSVATSVTITNSTVHAGRHLGRGGLANATYTNDIIQYGGEVQADAGITVAYS